MDEDTVSQAKRFLADLNSNVDAWYDGEIDSATFAARQRVTWNAICTAGRAVEEQVLSGIRDQLPTAQRANGTEA